jgi:hypothetical protein
MKLYEITEQHKQLEALAEEGADDMALAIKDTFEALEGDFNNKAISLIRVVNNMATDVAAIDNEIKRLQARKKTIASYQDSLKNYLRINMEATGIKKITCPIFTITLGAGRDMVLITDEDKIPTDFLKIETHTAPLKKEILAALKAGQDIPGAELGKSKTSIIIR